MCEVIVVKKEEIMDLYYIIKQFYRTYLISYHFIKKNNYFLENPYNCSYKHMSGIFSKKMAYNTISMFIILTVTMD